MSTLTHDEMADLCRLFRARQMVLARWTHEAHLIAVTDILFELGRERGGALMRELIFANNAQMGIPNSDTRGYHETITTLYIDEVAKLIGAPPCRDRDEAWARVLASPLTDSKFPLRRYSSERLWSVEARRGYVPPDLA